MKKLVTIALCLLMVAAISVTVFAATANFTMTPDSKTVSRGEEFVLTVNCSNSTPAYSYGVQLKFDSNVFEVVKGSIHSDVKNAGSSFSSFNKNKGFVFMFPTENDEGEAADPVAFTGKVGTVTFRVKADAPMGTYTIEGNTSIASPTVASSGCSATITVSCQHSYGSWTNAGADNHQRTCTKCGNVETKAHTWNSGVQTKAPTCTEAGVKTYTCSTCNATKTESVAKLGHKEGAGVQTKAPTCTEAGVKTFSCTRCGESLRTEAIAKLGHKEGTGKVTTAATCTKEGVKTYNCTRCSEVVRTEAVPVIEHNKQNATVTKEPTCKEEGVRTFSCSMCGAVAITEPIPTIPHTQGAGEVTKEPTCKEEGVKSYKCTACGDVVKTEAIPTVPHNYGDWTVGDANGHQKSCSVCGDVKTEKHAYDTATYVDEENHKAICSVCNGEVTVAHDWDDGVVSVAPTCQEDGVKTYTCAACEGTKTEAIPASEEHHVPGEWTVTVQPTYESAGSRESECTICGEKIVEELPAIAVPPTGDNSKIVLWTAILVLSACGLFATIFLMADKKHKYGR